GSPNSFFTLHDIAIRDSKRESAIAERGRNDCATFRDLNDLVYTLDTNAKPATLAADHERRARGVGTHLARLVPSRTRVEYRVGIQATIEPHVEVRRRAARRIGIQTS